MGKVIGDLRSALHTLQQLATGGKAARQTAPAPGGGRGGSSKDDYLYLQVEALQNAFVSLADIITDELDRRDQEGVWAAAAGKQPAGPDGGELSSAMRSLRQDVNDKMMTIEKRQAEMELLASSTRTELKALAHAEAEQMSVRHKALEQQIYDVRYNMQMVKNQLPPPAGVAGTVPAVGGLGAGTVKGGTLEMIEEVVHDVVRNAVPELVAKAVEMAVPGAVAQQLALVKAETLASLDRLGAGFELMDAQRQAMAADVAALQAWVRDREAADAAARTTASVSAAAAAASAAAINGGSTATTARAAADGGAAGTSGLAATVASLQDKLDALALQHARYARSMEDVVQVLADDGTAVGKRMQRLEGQMTQTRALLGDVKEAVVRSSQVFASVLRVPTPVPSNSLAAPVLVPAARSSDASGTD